MLKDYLIVAIRNLARHKAYTFINVAGLAIGLACTILILLFIRNEFSFDRHHRKADRIYRVIKGERQANGEVVYRRTGQGPLAHTMAAEFPDIERATRYFRNH